MVIISSNSRSGNSISFRSAWIGINTLLKKIGERSISGVITTNYDALLESIFDDYKPYIGQSELIFSPIQGVGEIYKIHGCCSKPNSIIITEDDYKLFNANNPYLSAKLLTIFLEHPIIFLGYSLNDENIRGILSEITNCLEQDQLTELKNRLIFVEWNDTNGPDKISTYNIEFPSRKNLEMTSILIKDYSKIYQVLLDNEVKSRYSISVLRKLKKDIYDLVLSNDPSSKIKVLSPYNKENENSEDTFEFVIGIGVTHEFGRRGLIGIKPADVYHDIIFDDFSEYPDFDLMLFLNESLPDLLRMTGYYMPIYKYISIGAEQGVTLDDLPREIKQSIKPNFDGLLSNTIRKDKARRPVRRSIKEIREDSCDLDCLYLASLINVAEIDLFDLLELIKDTYKAYPNILSKTSEVSDGYKTNFRRIIRIYDWLKYHKTT